MSEPLTEARLAEIEARRTRSRISSDPEIAFAPIDDVDPLIAEVRRLKVALSGLAADADAALDALGKYSGWWSSDEQAKDAVTRLLDSITAAQSELPPTRTEE